MKIEILYPEVNNLYGDLANIEYLAKCTDCEIINTAVFTEPAFIKEDVDLLYMASCTEKGQTLACKSLLPYKEELVKRIKDGKVTLFTGNALEILGKYIENDDKTKEEMLGIYDYYAVRRMLKRHNSLYLGKFQDKEIVGFKSIFAFTYGYNGEYLFDTERGIGNNDKTMNEGVKDHNFMATYITGPLLILNPDFTKYLLKLLGVNNPSLAYEEEAYEAYNERVKQFKDPKKGIFY